MVSGWCGGGGVGHGGVVAWWCGVMVVWVMVVCRVMVVVLAEFLPVIVVGLGWCQGGVRVVAGWCGVMVM